MELTEEQILNRKLVINSLFEDESEIRCYGSLYQIDTITQETKRCAFGQIFHALGISPDEPMPSIKMAKMLGLTDNYGLTYPWNSIVNWNDGREKTWAQIGYELEKVLLNGD